MTFIFVIYLSSWLLSNCPFLHDVDGFAVDGDYNQRHNHITFHSMRSKELCRNCDKVDRIVQFWNYIRYLLWCNEYWQRISTQVLITIEFDGVELKS